MAVVVTLNTLIYLIGSVVLLVVLMWGISEMTAYLVLAYYDWKARRNPEAIVTVSDTP